MLRNLTLSVLRYERVKTTEAKAKEVRLFVDRMINLGKDGSLIARRRALAWLPEPVIREQRPKTPHWKARVAYDGTDYAGFQVQPNAQTVQGELERALSTVCDGAVRVTGAGRTDAGVHASGQVIDFRTASTLDGLSIGRGVNALLPEDIAVSALEPAAEDFHARFSATGRTYEYRIRHGRERDPLERRRELHVGAA